MTGEYIDEDSWNNGTSGLPEPLDGIDLAQYMDSIREAVEQQNNDESGLMPYFDEERDPGVKDKVLSAVPSVELKNGELMGCTTVKLKEPLTEPEMEALQKYLAGQFSDGWGEGFEQQEIYVDGGVIGVHFWNPKRFSFEAEQPPSAEPVQVRRVRKRPKMKLVGKDGNVFSILGRASRLLRENGQPQQAEEMTQRVYHSVNYYKALAIISEYVETELSEKQTVKQKKRSGMERS